MLRERVGKIVRPILVLVILIPLVTFMMYPMINMQPRDIHLGIVSKDRGEEFDQGKVNLGDKLLENITDPKPDSEKEAADSPVIWEQFDSEKDAKAAMKRKEIYGYLLIPEDFSSKQTQTLTAFNNLSSALGKMSDGTGKMGNGISAMSGKFTQIPKAFKGLAKASTGLGKVASGMQTPAGMMESEASDIITESGKISANNEAIQQAITEAQNALSGEEPDVEAALTALEGVSIDDSSSSITQKAQMISEQSKLVQEGLGKIEAAETGMASNFTAMANKMSKVSNIKQLGAALSSLSEGLGSMSDNMDEKVSDAIGAINGDEEAEEEDVAKLLFHMDQSRNVMVSTTLTQMINGLSANAGIQVEMILENEIPEGLNNFYFSMVFMMLIMFTSMIPGILTGLTLKPSGGRKEKAKTIVSQFIVAAITALCVGLIIPRVVAWMGGFDLPIDELVPFVAICSFSMIMLIVGTIDLIGKPGVAVPVLIMFCGTAVANLPYEYLPAFWQKYVFPWEPLRFIAEGVREIIYRGGDAFNI